MSARDSNQKNDIAFHLCEMYVPAASVKMNIKTG